MTPPQYAAAVAAEVRAEMGRKQKNVDELAEVLGMTRPTAQGRLQGYRAFNVIELAQVALWLGVPLSTFAPIELGEVCS